MSNEMINVPRELAELCAQCLDNSGYIVPHDQLRALLAKPAAVEQGKVELERITDAYRAELDELAQRNYDLRFKHATQPQGEPVAWTWEGALDELKNGARAISVYRNGGPGTPVALYTRPAEQPAQKYDDTLVLPEPS